MARVPVAGLLAPVPMDHLTDGIEVCRQEGKVAFGSRAWEVFRDLQAEAGPTAPVLIYASHSGVPLGPVVSWRARYSGWVEAVGGIHPDGSRYRPPSTQVGPEDKSRYWAVFWEVTDLKMLAPDQRVPIRSLHDRRGRKLAADFVPEGPILIISTG